MSSILLAFPASLLAVGPARCSLRCLEAAGEDTVTGRSVEAEAEIRPGKKWGILYCLCCRVEFYTVSVDGGECYACNVLGHMVNVTPKKFFEVNAR